MKNTNTVRNEIHSCVGSISRSRFICRISYHQLN